MLKINRNQVYLIAVIIGITLLGLFSYIFYSKNIAYCILALPVLALVFYYLWTDYSVLFFVLCFTTPLAVGLKELGLTQDLDLSIPTEPLMIALLGAHLVNKGVNILPFGFNQHKLIVFIALQFVWMLLTVLSSTLWIVSIKQWVSRIWFFNASFVLASWVFQNPSHIFRTIHLYTFGLILVIVYTLITHAQYHFNDKAADWVVSPFYNDHTAYGAVLAMFIPFFLIFSFQKKSNVYRRWVYACIALLLICALVLSYARAGWLSLAIAAVVFIVLKIRISFSWILRMGLAALVIFLLFQTELYLILSKNSTDAKGGLANNIESVSNISTDASNRERINRWNCALRMWWEKPFLGWGPGTYMFKYAPFQRSDQLTIISTNFGDNGNAHSEYLGPLAEQGWPGLFFMLIVFYLILQMGFRVYYNSINQEHQFLVLSIFLGVVTYMVHGFFNNFLDTDKLSFPFWTFVAILMYYDCSSKGIINKLIF